LEGLLPIRKQGGLFPLASVSTALTLGRLIGVERISHFEDIENETWLKCFFGWDKLPDYTNYYDDLQLFENVEDVDALRETHGRLTERVLSKQSRVILDFDSSVNTVFGHQEGAEVGYHPVHPGNKSMHPLYVFEGNSRS